MDLGELLSQLSPLNWGQSISQMPARTALGAQWAGDTGGGDLSPGPVQGWDKSTLSTNGYYQPTYSKPTLDTTPTDPYYEQLNKLRDLLNGIKGSGGGGVADYSSEVGAAYDPQLEMIDRIMSNAKVVGRQNTAKTKDIYGGLKGQLRGAAREQAGQSRQAARDSARSYEDMTANDEAAFIKSRDAAVAELHRLGQDQSIPAAIEALQAQRTRSSDTTKGYQTASADLMNRSVAADNAYANTMANVVVDDLSAEAQHQLNMQLTQTLNQLGIKKADLASQKGQAMAQAKIQAALANAQRAQQIQQALFSGNLQLMGMAENHANTMYQREQDRLKYINQQNLAGIDQRAEGAASSILANVMNPSEEGNQPLYDLVHRQSVNGSAQAPSFSELSPYLMAEVKNQYPNISDYELSQIVAALREQLPR